jgi:hypothetical protein
MRELRFIVEFWGLTCDLLVFFAGVGCKCLRGFGLWGVGEAEVRATLGRMGGQGTDVRREFVVSRCRIVAFARVRPPHL